jgi:hypothetical protein
MRFAVAAALTGVACLLSGCASETLLQDNARPSAPTRYSIDGFVGSWGVASYRDEKDRKRTEAMAKAHCKQPLVIARGPTDGVMMYVADDPKLYELTLKGSPDGKTYIGFNAPPGDISDREVVSMSANEFVLRFVDPDAATRYGTMVYVRC